MSKNQPRTAISTDIPEKRRAERSSFFGLPNFRQVLRVTALGIVVTWFALMLVVPLMSNDLPMTTPWQRLQDLFLTHPTTVTLLLGVAVAFVLPNFAWLYVLFVRLRVPWRRS